MQWLVGTLGSLINDIQVLSLPWKPKRFKDFQEQCTPWLTSNIIALKWHVLKLILNTDLHLDNGNGVSLEKVDKFCYLGDMLDADGGSDNQSQICLKKVLWIPTILIGKGFSLKLKGKVYAICVSCLMHGSETWPMKVEHELKMNRTEMSMIRWMCGVKLNERKKSEELLGLEPVSLMFKKE